MVSCYPTPPQPIMSISTEKHREHRLRNVMAEDPSGRRRRMRHNNQLDLS